MKICGNCGNELKANDRFCSKCGIALPVNETIQSDRPDGGDCWIK